MAGRRSAPSPPRLAAPARRASRTLWWSIPLLCVLTLCFYWIPLTSDSTTPQWDAIDVHYSSQKYFADQILQAHLPFWTPYIFSGFPFLADPQVGAWYPPNWPFFLSGITAKAIEMEIALHTMLACIGMYLLLRRLTTSNEASLVGALFYGFSGFFADHTQHVGMFSTAAWLPWLALLLLRAIESSLVRWTAVAGLVIGAMILAGHFQAALYALYGLALFAIACAIRKREAALRIAGFVVAATVIGVCISAIQSLPGLELTSQSGRAMAGYDQSTERILHLKALLNLVWPNATGLFSGLPDSARGETAYYLYSGFLLLPLAALGWRDRSARITGLILLVPSIWYMLGPAWGLYRLGSILPGLHRVRAPIHAWFLAVFGLSIMAAAGVAWLLDRYPHRRAVAIGLAGFVFLDLFIWNSLINPGAYARVSFEERYGNFEENTRQKVMLSQPPLTRFHAPDKLTAFGPLNHPLDLHLEATYGYNPLELSNYADYRGTVESNPKLLSGLNVSRRLDMQMGAIVPVPDLLPRAYFARSIETVADDEASRTRLRTLDPAVTTLLNTGVLKVSADPDASVTIAPSGEQEYRLHYRAARPALLRMSIPFFPGWVATVGGTPCALARVDHAFLGIAVPAGENDLTLRYRSTYFIAGVWITILALAAAVAGVFLRPATSP